jgi:hypothetical protein
MTGKVDLGYIEGLASIWGQAIISGGNIVDV